MKRALVCGESKFVAAISPIVKSCGMEMLSSQTLRDSIVFQQAGKIDLVLVQEHFSDGTAEDLLRELRKFSQDFNPIIVLRRRDADLAVRWMEAGAYECLYEPLNLKEARVVIGGVARVMSGKFLPTERFWDRFSFQPQFSLKYLTVIVLAVSALLFSIWGGMVSYQKFSGRNVAEKKELPLSFRLPYQNPTGVAWDGKSLWICDWSVQTIYKHKIDSTLTLDQFFPITDSPSVSLTYGDNVLWTIGQDGTIRKHLLDGRLTVIAVIKLSGITPSAIAWDGRTLWSCDSQTRKIYKHVLDESLTVVASYDFPGKNPIGMVWVGRDLWVADEGTGRLYRLNFRNELFTLTGNPQPGVHLPGTNKLSGVCSDGLNLWTVSEGNGLIFRHPLSGLQSE